MQHQLRARCPRSATLRYRLEELTRQRPFDWSKYSQRHIALKVAYLGWPFHGLASQRDSDETIEAHLFGALSRTRLVEDVTDCDFSRAGTSIFFCSFRC